MVNSLLTSIIKLYLRRKTSNAHIIRPHDSTYGITADNVRAFRHDDQIVIGKYCSVAEGVRFILSGEHNHQSVSTFPFVDRYTKKKLSYKDTHTKGPIEVGNDVWIGFNALILSGVKIGDGAVIGAGSVVATDVPPYAIVVGNPCHVKKYRFSEMQIAMLLRIAWWNWPDELIRERIADFYGSLDSFLAKYAETEL